MDSAPEFRVLTALDLKSGPNLREFPARLDPEVYAEEMRNFAAEFEVLTQKYPFLAVTAITVHPGEDPLARPAVCASAIYKGKMTQPILQTMIARLLMTYQRQAEKHHNSH